MAREETDWRDGETELTTASGDEKSPAPKSVPGLTILAHADPRRVGERLTLPALALGHEVRLSRLEPVFRRPQDSAEAGRPLADRGLSRRPIGFVPSGGSKGAVILDASATRTPVIADGQKVDERRTFSAVDISRGVVLLLGRRVALLLHCMTVPQAVDLPRYGLVGDSDGTVDLRREIRRLAPLDVPVLLSGETGTGKELVARALHDAGARRQGPYVAVNMGALQPALAAAELFGAARGAFTGADRTRPGYFQGAQHGTLFLDEIGETSPEVQVMLLRVLESGEVQPVGSVETRRIDARVIAATDADLEAAVAAGRFRAPLYHRLAGYAVRLPALRERRDDIGRLFYHFLSRELGKLGEDTLNTERPWPPAEIVARLARHDWPGMSASCATSPAAWRSPAATRRRTSSRHGSRSCSVRPLRGPPRRRFRPGAGCASPRRSATRSSWRPWRPTASRSSPPPRPWDCRGSISIGASRAVRR